MNAARLARPKSETPSAEPASGFSALRAHIVTVLDGPLRRAEAAVGWHGDGGLPSGGVIIAFFQRFR